MIDWGLPDWRKKHAYGDFTKWPVERWRWEFSRRREDLRAVFDAHAEDHYQLNLRVSQNIGCDSRDLMPHEPGFIVICAESEAFGYMGIPNPRISEQPLAVLQLITNARETIEYFPGQHYAQSGPLDGANKVAIIFDVDKPLFDQLASAAGVLKAEQKARHGKNLQRKQHRKKWLNYLRVLDAREAKAPLEDIAQILIGTNRDPQPARDTWKQARALCFNF